MPDSVRSDTTSEMTVATDLPNPEPIVSHLQADALGNGFRMASSASCFSNLTCVKLDVTGTSFAAWRTCVTFSLQSEPDFFEVVTREIPQTDAAYARANALARLILINSLEIPLIQLKCGGAVSSQSAASDIFMEPTSEYENVAKSRQQTATKLVFTFRFDPSKTPTWNVKTFRQSVNQATQAGTVVDETILVSCLLEALPSSWVFLGKNLHYSTSIKSNYREPIFRHRG